MSEPEGESAAPANEEKPAETPAEKEPEPEPAAASPPPPESPAPEPAAPEAAAAAPESAEKPPAEEEKKKSAEDVAVATGEAEPAKEGEAQGGTDGAEQPAEHAETDEEIVTIKPKSRESLRASFEKVEVTSGTEERGSIALDVTQGSSLQIYASGGLLTGSLTRMGQSAGSLMDRITSSTAKLGADKLSSRAKIVLGSVIDIKSQLTGEGADRRAVRYANTYKMESDNPFNAEKVDNILKEVMVEALENLTYDPEKCPNQAKWASSAIRAKVKQLEYDRYKLVCIVTIGEKNSQDVYATCRFLWDAEKDRYATYALENTYVFGIAYCFGLYYE